MAENVVQTAQQFLQDVIAPDVRELKVKLSALEQKTDLRFDALEKKMDLRFKVVEEKFEALEDKMDLRFESNTQKMDAQFQVIESRFQILLATLREWRAQTELEKIQFNAEIAARIAAIESKRHLTT
jgi:hypothetical protein